MNKEFHIVKAKLNKMSQQSFIEKKVKEFLIENVSFDK